MNSVLHYVDSQISPNSIPENGWIVYCRTNLKALPDKTVTSCSHTGCLTFDQNVYHLYLVTAVIIIYVRMICESMS